MAEIVITIKDAQAVRIRDAICGTYGYKDQIEQPSGSGNYVPNSESRAAFAKRKVAEFVRDLVRSYEEGAAVKTARETAVTNQIIDGDIT